MEEKKIDVGYFAIKNYEELNQNEKEMAYDIVTTMIDSIDREYSYNADNIINESKKMLFVCGLMKNEILGACIPYSHDTLKNFDENYCYGYVPFNQLDR